MSDSTPLAAHGPSCADAEAAGRRRWAPWALASAGHVVLLALAALASLRAPSPLTSEPPAALVVILVESRASASSSADASSETASSEGGEDAAADRAPTFEFEFAARLDTAPLPALAVAMPPPSPSDARAVPDGVRAAIDDYLRCASTAPAEEAASAPCAEAAQRLARAGGAAGFDAHDFLDASLLERSREETLVRTAGAVLLTALIVSVGGGTTAGCAVNAAGMTCGVSAATYDDDPSVYTGTPDWSWAPEPLWIAYYEESPHLVDERIYDPEGRDIEARGPGAP